jgi:hypothetical protein
MRWNTNDLVSTDRRVDSLANDRVDAVGNIQNTTLEIHDHNATPNEASS